MPSFELKRQTVAVVLGFAFLFMSFLCAQQARTISSQRTLIQSLFHDSLELNAIKAHSISQRRAAANTGTAVR